MKDFIPDMLEGLKLFSNYEFFMTFNERLVYYNKNLLINILDLFQQKNTDEVHEFLQYYTNIIDTIRKEEVFPIIFDSKFFQNYCILFYKKNLKKLYSIYEILCFHNKNAKKKIINLEEEIMECYHKTGIYLIEHKKLFNEQIFDFLHKDKYLIHDGKVNEKK